MVETMVLTNTLQAWRTHGKAAPRDSQVMAMLVARSIDFDMANLGFINDVRSRSKHGVRIAKQRNAPR